MKGKPRSRRTVRAALIRAAERVDSGMNEMCCVALFEGKANDAAATMSARNYFADLFSPYDGPRGAEFWDKHPTPERQSLRVLALLFAAYSYEEE